MCAHFQVTRELFLPLDWQDPWLDLGHDKLEEHCDTGLPGFLTHRSSVSATSRALVPVFKSEGHLAVKVPLAFRWHRKPNSCDSWTG